jgi:hypothetical protein
MNKKGYFFTLDAAIGTLILIIGLLIIAGFYFYSPDKDRTESIANDLTGVLANTKMKDICDFNSDPKTCSYGELDTLIVTGYITNPDMSMLELMGYLYDIGYMRKEIELIINQSIIDQEILPINYDMQVIIEDPSNANTAQLYPLAEI